MYDYWVLGPLGLGDMVLPKWERDLKATQIRVSLGSSSHARRIGGGAAGPEAVVLEYRRIIDGYAIPL